MIHPTSTISPEAQIAPDVEIGAFCNIGKNVVLCSGVKLDHHIEINGDVTIGRNSHIFSFVKIGSNDQIINIGKSCTIREFTTIGTNKDSSLNIIEIGDRCYIMGYVQIKCGVTLKNRCMITNSVILAENALCQERVVIGAKATVAAGCIIGTGSMIGGVSCVYDNIPPFCLAEGYPKATIKGLNLVGMRRSFDDKESISRVKKAFMYLKKYQFNQDIAKKLLSGAKDKHEKKIIEFVALQNISQ